MSDNILGKTLGGRYEVREVIGTGGMAVVYKAYCKVLHRYVAIKVLKQAFARDDEFRRRFYNEAQAVAKLSHNNIVSIYDVSHGEAGMEYIVMELCEGVTLKDYLRKKGRLSWQETVYFAQQIARALDHAHSRGIIHQDIKPQNIMLLRDGTPKVMDFGIASFANKKQDTPASEAIGSVHYVSPEQAKGIPVDYRTDLYSLGIVMYEMLTGTLPFRGETAVKVVMQHLNGNPIRPSELVPDTPPAMDEIVLHAMSPNADMRYGSAAELYSDLERVRSNPNLYLNYTNRAAAFDSTAAIRYDDELESTQKISDLSAEMTAAKARKKPAQVRTAEPPVQKKSKKGDIGYAILATILVLLMIGMIYAVWHTVGTKKKQVTVPSFIGMNYEEDIVGSDLEKKFAFKISEITIGEDDDYKSGEVIEQDPEEGTVVNKGKTIKLVVARDEDVVKEKIPDVSGMDYDDAVAELRSLGFDTKRENRWSDTVERRDVIETHPQAGEEFVTGATVTLYVSRGSKEVEAPDLTGLNLDEAKEKLEEFGLELGEISYTETYSQPEGTVIEQSAKPGKKIRRGSKVSLTIAVEPAYVVDDEPEDEPEQPDVPDEPHQPDPEPYVPDDDGGGEPYVPDDGGGQIIVGDIT